MLDFHTHILPGLDDGSGSLEESLALLREEARQGVTVLALTPHFYAQRHSPAEFLRRRRRAWETLQSALEPGMPELLLGAEVAYFEGICGAEALPLLRLEGTQLLLLEMPLCPWTNRMIRDVEELTSRPGYQVVLAHIERYIPLQKKQTLERLRRCGALWQVSVSCFARWQSRRAAMALLRAEQIHFLGSDCHNMKDRRPNWERLPEEALRLARHSRARVERYRLSAEAEKEEIRG